MMVRSRGTPVPTDTEWLKPLKVGDKVVRWLAGVVPMVMIIVADRGDRWICDQAERGRVFRPEEADHFWAFDKATGVEIDEVLGFGPRTGLTGSFLRPWTAH